MKILIAEDDPVSRTILKSSLLKWGYEVVVASDGSEAWKAIQKEDAPLAILDWMMPELTGTDLCRMIRELPGKSSIYIILLTAKGSKVDIVEGLGAGADDYITKPFDREELKARLQAGIRIIELQRKLSDRVEQLETAAAHIKTLQGFLPICSYCKKIRTDQNYWQQLESYLSEHSELQFSHGICPECYEKLTEERKKKREPPDE